MPPDFIPSLPEFLWRSRIETLISGRSSAKIGAATNAVAARIQTLIDKVNAGTATTEEIAAVLQPEVDRLTQLGKDPHEGHQIKIKLPGKMTTKCGNTAIMEESVTDKRSFDGPEGA
jgi:hypothetical protein